MHGISILRSQPFLLTGALLGDVHREHWSVFCPLLLKSIRQPWCDCCGYTRSAVFFRIEAGAPAGLVTLLLGRYQK
jgi:hypothetical protein